MGSIPGLSSAAGAQGIVLAYGASVNNVDPWVASGSIAAAQQYSIFVGTGVVIGSTSPASPSMLLRPYHLSVVNLFVSGKIGAAGGVGGGGDRGRMNGSNPSSSFVGGGGGGGAGTEPGAGGLAAIEPDPDNDAEDGTAGTTTLGGAGGLSDSGAAIPNSGTFTAGSQLNRIARNPAILIWPANGHSVTVNVWNQGSIFAGGDGGLGGYQDGSLPGHDGANGEDLPSYYDAAPGALTDHPAIGYRSGQVTLNIVQGASHPAIKGRIIAFTVAP